MFRLENNGTLFLNEAVRLILDKIQKQGNSNVRYQTDKTTYHISEKWAYPKFENEKFVGDCEDISLYKRKLLIEAGIPKEILLLTVCLTPGKTGHCVLSVITNKRDYILCNSHVEVTTPMEMKNEGYVFLYRQGLGRGINQAWDVLK